MTTRFIDGPAAGIVLELQRAPIFLRAVVNEDTEKWDALDQLDDEAAANETIHVYVVSGKVSGGIACSRGKNGGCCPFFQANYKLYHTQPPQADLRRLEFWAEWTHQQYSAGRHKEAV